MKRLLILTLITAVAFSVVAQEGAELRDDHPREYVVERGDTLWDIAGRFLKRPWYWPAIWQANEQIENPHLIYPGDVISLVYVDGEPRLTVSERTRRLSPEVRREGGEGPINTIPIDAIEPFLHDMRVLDKDTVERLPYIVANNDQRVTASTGDRVYARGMDNPRPGDQVVIARMTWQFQDMGDGEIEAHRMRNDGGYVPSYERAPGAVWQATFGRNRPIIGYELWEAARGEVVRGTDPTIIELGESEREVRAGDYVLPVDQRDPVVRYVPRPMASTPENARVVAATNALYGVGQYQIVAINIGRRDGVEGGHTFAAFNRGETIRDEVSRIRRNRPKSEIEVDSTVDLPEQYAGHVMVFRPFERISYAIVLEGERGIKAGDGLYHPDRPH